MGGLVQVAPVRVKWLNWVVVISPVGHFPGGKEIDELLQAMEGAIAGDYQGVVLNAAGMRLVNSTALGAFIAGSTRARRAAMKMAICCVSERNRFLLPFLNLPHFDTEEEAIRFCSSR